MSLAFDCSRAKMSQYSNPMFDTGLENTRDVCYTLRKHSGKSGWRGGAQRQSNRKLTCTHGLLFVSMLALDRGRTPTVSVRGNLFGSNGGHDERIVGNSSGIGIARATRGAQEKSCEEKSRAQEKSREESRAQEKSREESRAQTRGTAAAPASTATRRASPATDHADLAIRGYGRLMGLIGNWILRAALLFVLATSKGKRKPVKKRVKRPTRAARSRVKRLQAKRARVKKTARPPKRSPQQVARGRLVAARARPPLQPSVTPAVAHKPVEPEPPPRPVPPIGRAILLSPENEKFVDHFHPTFRWLSVGGATRYEVAWSEEPALTASNALLSIATEATVPVEKSLQLGGTYYWRVRGGNESGWGPWSAIASFHVLEEIT